MKWVLVWLSLASTLVMVAPAHAALQWNLTSHPNGDVTDLKFISTGSDAVGLRMYAIADTGTNGLLQVAGVNSGTGTIDYGSGVGVKNNNEAKVGSPGHAMDNKMSKDMVLFVFDEPVTLESLKIGWHYKDSDMTVMAFTGNTDPVTFKDQDDKNDRLAAVSNYFGDKTYGGTNNIGNAGWQLIGHPTNVASNPNDTATFNQTNPVTSSYWLIGALNDAVGGAGSLSNSKDYVKLFSIGAGDLPDPEQNTNSVPAPTTLLLLGPGLLLLCVMRRRGHLFLRVAPG